MARQNPVTVYLTKREQEVLIDVLERALGEYEPLNGIDSVDRVLRSILDQFKG